MSSESCYYSHIHILKSLANVGTLDFKYRLINILSYLVVPKYPDALSVCSPKTGSNRDDFREMRMFHLSGFTTQRTQHGEHSRNSGEHFGPRESTVSKTAQNQPQNQAKSQTYTSRRAGFLTRVEERDESPQKKEETTRSRWGRTNGRCQCNQAEEEDLKPHYDAENTMETSTSAYGVSLMVSQTKTGILTPSAHIFSCGTDSLLTPRQLNTIFCTSRPLSPAL